MITLCMDTSSTYLVIAVIKDGTVIGSVQEECWKKQSELLFPRMLMLLEELKIDADDIDEVVVTEGPGSYTGVRIAMTVAKVLASSKQIPLATLSTLQLIAGMNDTCRVLLDAHGKRVYTGVYNKGELVGEMQVMGVDELKEMLKEDEVLIGDGQLVGTYHSMGNLAQNFLDLKDKWNYQENVHTVKPEYLKTSESYLPNK